MQQISVLIVDDHPVVRQGLKYMLESSPHISVVGEASTALEGMEMISKLCPSVVLMDIEIPGMNGVEATQHITEQSPQVPVVVMTVHTEDDYVSSALQAGAVGYILKDAPSNEICRAVESAAMGEMAIRAALFHRAIDWNHESATSTERPQSETQRGRQVGDLTDRENVVLRLLAQGLSNKEIGAQLYISRGTVKKHVENILAKLSARDRTDAVAIAMRLGLVE